MDEEVVQRGDVKAQENLPLLSPFNVCGMDIFNQSHIYP